MDIHSKVQRFVGLILCTGFLFGCASRIPRDVDFEVIPAHFEVAYQEIGPKIFILKSENDLKKAMELLQLSAPDGLPDLNFYFEQHTVLLLYGGMQRSNGFMFGAESVQAKKQSVTITARLLQPAADCIVASVITYPMQLIAIDHLGGNDFSLDLVNAMRPCR
jgi:hypothetical protein